MSYMPTTWAKGDTITSAKLNKIEQGIEDAQNGWSVTTNTLFSESITTTDGGDGLCPSGLYAGTLAYTTQITADSITVTFDGVEYNPPHLTDATGGSAYGEAGDSGPDFTNYPFFISSMQNGTNMVYTENEGTYSISAGASGVTTTDDFDTVVAKTALAKAAFEVVIGTTTFREAYDALVAGKRVYILGTSGSNRVYQYPVIGANTSSYEILFIVVWSSDTDITLSKYSASSADGVLS